MSEKYKNFYTEWEKSVDRAIEEDQLAQWRNMRALYLMFEQQFNESKIQIQKARADKDNGI